MNLLQMLEKLGIDDLQLTERSETDFVFFFNVKVGEQKNKTNAQLDRELHTSFFNLSTAASLFLALIKTNILRTSGAVLSIFSMRTD